MKNLELWDACGNRVIIAQKENMDLMTSLSISFKNEVAALLQTYKADTMMLCSTDGKVVRVLESDLSESNMCGNGIRAVHKYFTGLNHVYLTLAGKVECHLLNDGNVSVKMGRVNLHGQIKYKGFNLYLSDVGEPHAVLLVDDIAQADLIFNNHGFSFVNTFFDEFDTNFNLNVVEVVNNQLLIQRTFERGVNAETLACGTGATCSFFVSNQMGLCLSEVKIKVLGGELHLKSNIDKIVHKNGPAIKIKDLII